MRLAETLELMRAYSLRHLPVVDDEGRFVGVVNGRDVEAELTASGGLAAERGILGIVELGTPSLHGDESIENVWARLARAPGLNPLPVIQDGKLIGTVSQHELLRALAGLPPQNGNGVSQAVPTLRDWASRSTPAESGRSLSGA
jgi:CBS domain-containing protein